MSPADKFLSTGVSFDGCTIRYDERADLLSAHKIAIAARHDAGSPNAGSPNSLTVRHDEAGRMPPVSSLDGGS